MAPIGIKTALDPDEEVERQMLKSLSQALESHMSALFSDLCYEVPSDAPAALKTFAERINVARKAYLDARTIINAEGKL